MCFPDPYAARYGGRSHIDAAPAVSGTSHANAPAEGKKNLSPISTGGVQVADSDVDYVTACLTLDHNCGPLWPLCARDEMPYHAHA